MRIRALGLALLLCSPCLASSVLERIKWGDEKAAPKVVWGILELNHKDSWDDGSTTRAKQDKLIQDAIATEQDLELTDPQEIIDRVDEAALSRAASFAPKFRDELVVKLRTASEKAGGAAKGLLTSDEEKQAEVALANHAGGKLPPIALPAAYDPGADPIGGLGSHGGQAPIDIRLAIAEGADGASMAKLKAQPHHLLPDEVPDELLHPREGGPERNDHYLLGAALDSGEFVYHKIRDWIHPPTSDTPPKPWKMTAADVEDGGSKLNPGDVILVNDLDGGPAAAEDAGHTALVLAIPGGKFIRIDASWGGTGTPHDWPDLKSALLNRRVDAPVRGLDVIVLPDHKMSNGNMSGKAIAEFLAKRTSSYSYPYCSLYAAEAVKEGGWNFGEGVTPNSLGNAAVGAKP